MDQELIPVTGTALIILITKLTEYLGPHGARHFCGLLQTTGSWVLGSFVLMALTETSVWMAGDIDVYVNCNDPTVFTIIALFSEVLFRARYQLQRGWGQYYEEESNVVQVLTFGRTLLARNCPPLRQKVQIIVDKSSGNDNPFPLSVLRRFDLSCCCCAFNGVYLYRAAWNIMPMFYTQHQKVKLYRVEKYKERGYVFLPDFGPDPIDPQDDMDDNDAPANAPPAMAPLPPPLHVHLPPATCQVMIRRTKLPCGRLLIAGHCPIHK